MKYTVIPLKKAHTVIPRGMFWESWRGICNFAYYATVHCMKLPHPHKGYFQAMASPNHQLQSKLLPLGTLFLTLQAMVLRPAHLLDRCYVEQRSFF